MELPCVIQFKLGTCDLTLLAVELCAIKNDAKKKNARATAQCEPDDPYGTTTRRDNGVWVMLLVRGEPQASACPYVSTSRLASRRPSRRSSSTSLSHSRRASLYPFHTLTRVLL